MRFVKEYANYLIQDSYEFKKIEKAIKIRHIYSMYERGYITTDEAMRTLVEISMEDI